MSAEKLAIEGGVKAITKRTKAIVPVHMRGAPAQMDAIMDIANKKGIAVIENAAQAGCKYAEAFRKPKFFPQKTSATGLLP